MQYRIKSWSALNTLKATLVMIEILIALFQIAKKNHTNTRKNHGNDSNEQNFFRDLSQFVFWPQYVSHTFNNKSLIADSILKRNVRTCISPISKNEPGTKFQFISTELLPRHTLSARLPIRHTPRCSQTLWVSEPRWLSSSSPCCNLHVEEKETLFWWRKWLAPQEAT